MLASDIVALLFTDKTFTKTIFLTVEFLPFFNQMMVLFTNIEGNKRTQIHHWFSCLLNCIAENNFVALPHPLEHQNLFLFSTRVYV